GDRVDVLMRAGADVAPRLGVDRRIMEQPHHRIAVADGIDEVILVDLQKARDRLENLEAGLIEGVVQFAEGPFEALDLGRPDIVRHMATKRVPRRQVAADVPKFLEVVSHGALGSLYPERGIAPRSAAAVNVVAALHV